MRARLWWRLATCTPGASLVIALVVAITACLLTAWPRLLQQVGLDEVNHRITATPPTVRALRATVPGWPVPVPEWADMLRTELGSLAASAGEELRDALGAPVIVLEGVSTPILGSGGPTDLATRSLRVRVDPDIGERVRLVEGDLPGPAAYDPAFESAYSALLSEGRFGEFEAIVTSPDLPPSEVMISAASAARLGLAVGEVVQLPAFWSNGLVRVVGLFEAVDPDDPYWQAQVSVLRPLVVDDPQRGLLATATVYPNPGTLRWIGSIEGAEGVTTTQLWFPVEPRATDAGALLTDLRDLTARSVPLAGLASSPSVEFSSDLTDVLERALSIWSSTEAVLTVALAGPVGVTFALLSLTVRLAVTRRRATLALAAARGGSPWLLRGALAAEGMLLGFPAAALGAVAATLAIPGAVLAGHYLAAGAAGLAPAAFLAVSPIPSLRPTRSDLGARASSRWRWVGEVGVAALAAGAVYLLLDRGVAADAATAGVDPVAAAAPFLIAVTVALLVARLFPVLLRAVHAITRRRRDLAPFLGSARAIREGSSGLATLLAVVVGLSITVFSTTMQTTVDRGVSATARGAVGADVRLAGPYYTADDLAAIRAVDGVASLTEVVELPRSPLVEVAGSGSAVDRQSRRVAVLAVDTTTLAATQRGVAGAVALPPGMAGLVDGRVPVLLAAGQQVTEGVELELLLEQRVPITVVGRAPDAVGLASGDSWAIADLGLLREVSGQRLPARIVLVGLAEGTDPDAALAGLGDAVGGRGTITSPTADEADFLASPSAAALQRGFGIAVVVAAVQVVFAVVLALVLAAPVRARLLAVLRTLGISARDARRLVWWETVPAVVVAAPVGAALGLALPYLVRATVDLRPFTGGDGQPPIAHDWLPLVGVVGGAAVVTVGAVLVAGAIARRLSRDVLRMGDDAV